MPGANAPTVKGEFRALGILATAAGFLLLAENAGWVGAVHNFWPVFPAFLGIGLILLFRKRWPGDLLLLGLGTYLLGVSILFLVLNYTSWWALTRAWPVFVALLGVSSWIASFFSDSLRLVLSASGTLLILMAGVFYLVFTVNPGLWPVSMILFGLWVLFVTWARGARGQQG